MIERFPPWIKSDYLNQAANLRCAIARSLPDAVAERVFHFRATKLKTWVELHWKKIDGDQYDHF